MSQIEWIGIVPAAGQATRLGHLPCSKEIYPIRHDASNRRTEVACESLLHAFRDAGLTKAYVVIGQGKWDIPAYLDDGSFLGLQLAYLTIRDSPSPCHTIDRAYHFAENAMVAFGFPDILVEPTDSILRLRQHQDRTGADVVLGLFPAARPQHVDMVVYEDTGRIVRLDIKPHHTTLTHTWTVAVWTPSFSAFLHDRVARLDTPPGDELHVGHIVQQAIDAGWSVQGIPIQDGWYRDLGTPDDLATAHSPSVFRT